MPRFTTAVAAFGLAASVLAQSGTITSSAAQPSGSVVSVFLLDTDTESLVASLIGESNGVQTLAVQCAPGVSSDECGYPEAVTFTAGPSTVHASASNEGVTAEYGCDITDSTTGVCSVTYIGQASDLATDESASVTATGITTIITTGTLTGGDITYFPITITAGAGIAAASSAASTTSHSGSTSSGASSRSSAASASSSHSSSSASASHALSAVSSAASSAVSSSMSHAGAGQMAAPGFLAAGILGLAAFL